MNQYQFERILRRMEQRYGKIAKGKENDFNGMLMGMELNLYQTWQENHACNGWRVQEAALLALYRIEDRLTGKETDVSAFESPENLSLRNAFLDTFDPLFSESVREVVEATADLSDLSVLERFYRIPVQCMLRIRESAVKWTKEWGPDGYFLFVKDFLPSETLGDTVEVFMKPDLYR